MSPRKKRPASDSKDTTNTTIADADSQAVAVTAVAEPPSAAVDQSDTNFAERVGQKQKFNIPDPFCIATDVEVGVRLLESRQDRQMAIKFGEGRLEDKPSQAVITKLKDAGYRWNHSDKIWAHPVRADGAMSTRIEAERLFREVSQMIRQEKGMAAGPEVPF